MIGAVASRESVMAALFERVAALDGFASASRRLRHWSDVAAGEQPALFMTQRSGGLVEQVRGQPARLTLRADLYVYVRTGEDVLPATVLNGLLDAIAAALASDVPHDPAQTLGGLVHHCWIDGEIETDDQVGRDRGVGNVLSNGTKDVEVPGAAVRPAHHLEQPVRT